MPATLRTVTGVAYLEMGWFMLPTHTWSWPHIIALHVGIRLRLKGRSNAIPRSPSTARRLRTFLVLSWPIIQASMWQVTWPNCQLMKASDCGLKGPGCGPQVSPLNGSAAHPPRQGAAATPAPAQTPAPVVVLVQAQVQALALVCLKIHQRRQNVRTPLLITSCP